MRFESTRLETYFKDKHKCSWGALWFTHLSMPLPCYVEPFNHLTRPWPCLRIMNLDRLHMFLMIRTRPPPPPRAPCNKYRLYNTATLLSTKKKKGKRFLKWKKYKSTALFEASHQSSSCAGACEESQLQSHRGLYIQHNMQNQTNALRPFQGSQGRHLGIPQREHSTIVLTCTIQLGGPMADCFLAVRAHVFVLPVSYLALCAHNRWSQSRRSAISSGHSMWLELTIALLILFSLTRSKNDLQAHHTFFSQ